MKAFGSLAALFAVSLGFASAGPLAGNGGSASMCDIKCHSDNLKLKYTPGQTYVYKYSTKTETSLEQTSQEKSTIYLDADVSLHVIDHCRFALKVDSAKLEEELSGGARKASQGTQELAASLVKNPLVFNFLDGIVSRICPAVQESKSVLNIKRGIISMIQNKMAEFVSEDVAFEDDVTGECLTWYAASKKWGGQVTIVKKKSLSNCRRENDKQVVSAIALPRKVARSSSMINGTQECEQIVKNDIFQSVECRERHVVRPFSRQEKGASTDVHQSLRLQRSGPNVQASYFQYSEGDVQTLQFDHLADFEGEWSQMEERARGIIQRLGAEKHTEIKHTNDLFSKLVEALRKMRYEALKKLATEFRGHQLFLNALTSTMSGESMKLVTELVKEKVIGTNDAKAWLIRAALATDVDVSRIPMMMSLIDMEDITVEAHLAVSAMARTYMEENPSHVPQEIRDLLHKLYSQLRPETSEKTLIATIKAIGNLGITHGQEHKLLEVTARRNPETRLAAVEAFRQFPCDKVDRQMLMDIFTSGSENIEVRIGAYLNSIVCPTEQMIATVRDTLLREPNGSQLSSFVFTHVKNLAKRSSFNEDVSPITSDETLKSLELDSINYSKNYFYEMFFNPLDLGFEVDAGSIFSNEINSLMLNTTFDLFGHKVNMFDSKVRVQSDMKHFDGFVRFFGKEVFYKKMDNQKTPEFDSILKTIMSPTGWKFTRSMMVLDTEMVVPMGSGLPLIVAVNATATLGMDLKAMPLQRQQGSNYVAEARSAPSLAVRFGVSMMVKAPKTTSGIKMIATASSQWEVTGRVNMDLSDSRMLRNIQISAPRDRSDIIDIKSDVYLVGANEQREIKVVGAPEKSFEFCTGETLHKIAGHELCLMGQYPAAPGSESPLFFLRGPNHLNIRWVKTDKSLETFQIQSTFIYGPRELLELAFTMDTPGSEVDRHFKGRLYSDFPNKQFGIDLISPMKTVSLEGTYLQSPNNKKTQILFRIDGKTEMAIMGGWEVANGRVTIMSPFLEVALRGKQLLLVKSQIATHGNQKYNGDMEIHSMFTEKPIKMIGEYSALSDKQRLTFGIDSYLLQSNVESILSLNGQNWEVTADGDYVYNQGVKEKFSLGGKLTDDRQTVAVQGSLKRNGVSIVSGGGRIIRGTPLNFDFVVDLLEGRFKGAVSLATDNQKSTLTAMALKDNEKYLTSIKFQLMPQLTSVIAKFELPNNVERMAQLQYDFMSPVKRMVVETDLSGKIHSARISYSPSETLHKVSANVKMDKESAQLSAALGIDSVYQAKLDITHKGVKVVSTSFGINRDMKKPNMKAYVGYWDKPLLDLSTDTTIEPRRLSMGLTVRAPVQLNANVGLKSSGAVANTLRVEAEVDVKSQDRAIDIGMSSTAEISLFQRSNKVNVETTMKCPRGTTTVVFKNVLDSSSWSIDWRLQRPDQEKQQVLSSGTYNLDSQKLHLRGVFEMDVRPFGHHVVVEPLALNSELSANQNEVDFRSELTKNTKTTVLLLALRASNQKTRKHLSAEMNIMGKLHHVQFALDGQDLESGFRTSLDGRWQDETVVGKGNLRWDGKNVHVNMDLQSSFEKLAKAKILLETQTVNQNTRVINAEYVLGNYFVKGEMNVDSKFLLADIRTSFEDWQNVKAKASWELKPKMLLTVDFSTPKYEGNVVELEMDRLNGLNGRVRLTVPSMFRGNLVDGTLKYMEGKGKVNLLYKGQPKGKLLFELQNEDNVKTLSTALSYELNGAQNLLNFDVDFRNTGKNAYDGKLTLRKDSKLIVDLKYGGTLKIEGGILAESKLEAQTTLLKFWPSIYMFNKLIVTSDNVHTQHEVGTSPKSVHYGIDASGRLTRNRDMLVLEGKLDGQWERTLKGSVSAELKSDKNSVTLETRAESNNARVFSTKWELTRQDRLVELEANWEASRLQHEGLLKMKSGFEDDESFVLDVKLDRNRDAEKTAEISLRLPLQARNVEGHLKVKLPRELGGQALMGSLMSKKSMFNANAELSMDNGRQTYSGQADSKWEQGLTFNGALKKNNNNVARAGLTASWKLPGTYEISAEVMGHDVSYKGKLSSAFMQETGRISMEAESSQWQQKHTIRGSYSMDSKTADLKVDIANLKMNIDAMMSGSYRLQANVEYNGEKIGELNFNFNPTTKQGSVDGEWYEKRMSTTFVARVVDGELKMELPTGSSALTWSLDKLNKLSVQGHYNFDSDNYRLEVVTDPSSSPTIDATLYHVNRRVGSLSAHMRSDEIAFFLQFNHDNVEHSVEASAHRREGSIGGFFKLQCPWVTYETIDSKFDLTYTRSRFNFTSALKFGPRIHSIKMDGKLAGERITGTVETHCPIYGNMSGSFEGTWSQDGFKVKFTSAQLKESVEVEGLRTREKTSFTVKSEGYEMRGAVYTGDKFGFELHGKTETIYEIVAVMEKNKMMRFTIQTPWIARSGIVLTQHAAAEYGVEGQWLGKTILQAQWTATDNTMLDGVFDGVFDFGGKVGTHKLIVKYNVKDTPSIDVELDGHKIFVSKSRNGNHAVMGKLTLNFAQTGDVTLDFNSELGRESWLNSFKVIRNDKTLGYEMRLHRDILGSMLRIDTPRRSFLMELNQQEPSNGGSVVGRLAWDHGRDQAKSIEMSLSRNNNVEGAGKEHHLTISIPKLNEKVTLRVTETEDGHHLQALDDKRFKSSPRMSLMYSKEGRVKMTLGNLIMQGEMSSAKSELVVRRMTSEEDDINVGYNVQGNTLSARLHWTPRLLVNSELALTNMMEELQKGHGNHQDKQWRRVTDFIEAELLAIGNDVRSMITDLKRLYEQNTWNLKTIFESVLRGSKHFSEYVEYVYEEVYETFRGFRKTLTRYGQRFVVAMTVIDAIQQEIREDVVESIERWVDRFEKSIPNESIRNLVQRLINYVKQDYETIVDALDYAVDEYVCEFTSEQAQVTNKQCGFAYELYSQQKQHGLMMRLPVLAAKSS